MRKATIQPRLRIVLFSDNKDRELQSLLLVKKALEKKLKASVFIFGSLAERQRMLLALEQTQPHLVVISQVFEKSCRELASYAKQSGAIVVILPCEIRASKAYSYLVKNKLLSYRQLVDYLFIPGKSLQALFNQTDIPVKQIFLVGSPKIDVVLQKTNKRMSRKSFCDLFSIPHADQNIFFFPSFLTSQEAFLRQDVLFSNQLHFQRTFNHCVKSSREAYQRMLLKVADDFPNCSIIVKPHPLEKTNYTTLTNCKNNLFLVQAPIEHCLDSIDLAVHWMSTVAIECWLHQIKVIEYFPIKKYQSLLPDFSPGNPVVFNYRDLKSNINNYLLHPIPLAMKQFQQKYLKDNYFSLDGCSATRIAVILQSKITDLPQLNYRPKVSIVIRILFALERIVGIRLSRKMLLLIKPNFQVDYAINNYVNLH
ncbi:MAG: hypothetical protein COY81_00240 [Candidatus Pacebacteria bacterium CG_4_10_14_0_8_um_filter_43_12]|nr:MAG: hypothetical protein COY81_00240 [Candidatus Pacebacteria bacterium CG_4_10_14_0_8_um_filter_43_12]